MRNPNSGYNGFLWNSKGERIYGSYRDSPGKYKPVQPLSKYKTRSISQFDWAELVSISTQLACRIPALRASIRDKNQWANARGSAMYFGDNEKWGQQAEEWLNHEVFPRAVFMETSHDLNWGFRVSGMGLDMAGDNLMILTEDEYHAPRAMFIPAPRIGNGDKSAMMLYSSIAAFSSSTGYRADGLTVVDGGKFKGCLLYNGIIRRNGRPVAIRIMGIDDAGNQVVSDLDLGVQAGTCYAAEYEFFGQGRPVPRIAASILQLSKGEEIDDQLMKALAIASAHTVVHQLPPGTDAIQARGNAITMSRGTNYDDGAREGDDLDHEVYTSYSPDGNVMYIHSDETFAGMPFANPHQDMEDYAVRRLRECIRDCGWSYAFIDTGSTGRSPTRLETEQANTSIHERQMTEKPRRIAFMRYAVMKGVENGDLPRNDADMGRDALKWGIGFPAQMSVDQGNDVKASLDLLRMGVTCEAYLEAKNGQFWRTTQRQRLKEIMTRVEGADQIYEFVVNQKGHKDVTFERCMEWLMQISPNSSQTTKATEALEDPAQPAAKPAKGE